MTLLTPTIPSTLFHLGKGGVDASGRCGWTREPLHSFGRVRGERSSPPGAVETSASIAINSSPHPVFYRQSWRKLAEVGGAEGVKIGQTAAMTDKAALPFITLPTMKEITNAGPALLAGNKPKGQEEKFHSVSIQDAEWARLPSPRGRCPVSGLSRSGVIDLAVIVPGLVVRLRRPGAIRGACLVHLPTLRQYLRDMREAQIGRGVES